MAEPEKNDEPEKRPESERPSRVEGRRVYCAWEECGKKLEKGRKYYCAAHDFWPK
jgi:hypothetical protein